jgi:hypothetical protein
MPHPDFCVSKADIAAAGYDLSLNRYKEVEHDQVNHESPAARQYMTPTEMGLRSNGPVAREQ